MGRETGASNAPIRLPPDLEDLWNVSAKEKT